MGFKEDADFARFVSMGAVATDAVRTDLKRHGHEAIELERFAMSNKVWQTKVKRMRVPDLVCTRCGLRIESRGKSQLGIIVSHSDAGDRSWDAGMRDDDLYAFLRLDLNQEPIYASRPTYFRTRDMRASVAWAKESNRKAISEGSEVTLTWAAWVPSKSGTFIDTDAEGRLVCQWEDGRRTRYWHWKNWPARKLYVTPGDDIIAGETMIAGLVAAPQGIGCPGGWDLRAALRGAEPGERYAAVKVAGVTRRSDLIPDLVPIAEEEHDWRVRLEAQASLARMDASWVKHIIATASTSANSDDQRIEAVFVLSEIPTDDAASALDAIAADDGRKPRELRAAAVWGLARGVHPCPDLVLPYASDSDEFVALHAIAGLPSIPENLVSDLIEWLGQDDRRAAAAAQVLLRHNAVHPLLAAVHEGGRKRLWALRALGDLHPDIVNHLGSPLLTLEIERDLEPIWIGHEDWLRGESADGLDALDIQKVRFNPLIDDDESGPPPGAP